MGLAFGVIVTSLTVLSFASDKAFINVLETNQATFELPSALGWEEAGNASISQTTEQARHGKGSLKVAVSSTGDYQDDSNTARVQTRRAPDGIPIFPGAQYKGEIQIKANNTGLKARCEIRWYDSNNNIISTNSDARLKNVSSSKWRKLICGGKAPDNAVQGALRAYLDGTTKNEDIVYLDTAQFGYYEDASGTISGASSYQQLLSDDQTSFDSNKHDWVANQNVALETSSTISRSGGSSLKVTVGDSGRKILDNNVSRFTAKSSSTEITPGDRYIGSVWVQSIENTKARARCSIVFKLSDGLYRTLHGESVSVTNKDWTLASCAALVPDNAVTVFLTVYLTKTTNQDVVYIDDAGLWNIDRVEGKSPNPAPEPTPTPPQSPTPTPEPEPTPPPDPAPEPKPPAPEPAPEGTPIAVTLNNSNTGPRPGTTFKKVDTLYINENKVYSGYEANHVVVESSGKGAKLIDSKVISTYPYGIEVQASGINNPEDFVMEYVYVKKTNNGKAILGGGFTLKRSRISGGEDGLHLNRGSTLVQESIIEEQEYPPGSHSDSIQLTSGGVGGTLTIEDSILQIGFREQNAPLQVNVTSSTIISRRNWYHGGVYLILGDSGNFVSSTDDMFAYGTSKFGFVGGVSVNRTRPVWWSRQVRPRLSTPNATLPGEAPGFPGNGTAITGSGENGYYSESKTNY